jgi:hypothetical protein
VAELTKYAIREGLTTRVRGAGGRGVEGTGACSSGAPKGRQHHSPG